MVKSEGRTDADHSTGNLELFSNAHVFQEFADAGIGSVRENPARSIVASIPYTTDMSSGSLGPSKR